MPTSGGLMSQLELLELHQHISGSEVGGGGGIFQHLPKGSKTVLSEKEE